MDSEALHTDPSRACPDPGRWHTESGPATEIEVSALAGAFVRALRVDFAIETGSAEGCTAQTIGEALKDGGTGKLYTFDPNPKCIQLTRERCTGLPVQAIQKSSLTGIAEVAARIQAGKLPRIGFAWLDSLFELRPLELRAITPLLTYGAVVGIHDCGQPGAAKFPDFSRVMADLAEELGYRRISLPTPRGVTFLSRKAWW